MDKKTDRRVSEKEQQVWWGNLACPSPPPERTNVILSRAVWGHILTKHVIDDREPWRDLLPAGTREALAAHPTESLQSAPVAAAVGSLECQVRESLARPLVLLFEVQKPGASGGRGRERWCLVLPAGATAYVAARGGTNNFLVTCYFPRESAVERDRQRRWRRVVRRLVLRYAVWDAQLGAIRLPDAGTVQLHPAKSPARASHSAIRFVTAATWGFCPELTGVPWRGRLTPWSAAEPLEPCSWPTPRRHRIKPSRRVEHGN